MSKINQFIKFKPILKEKIWGGTKLVDFLGKESIKDNIGESWEVSGVKGDASIISNGLLKGNTIDELIKKYTSDVLGIKVYKNFGEKFPLLFKFIDAKEDLSIQVHPNDNQAKKKHDSLGKTEMWYVMQADKNANLIVGFKKDSSKEEYVRHLEENNLLDILNVDEVESGDVYFIPAGRIHAIGAGVLLAEIQETSDITYRIYDWQRKDNEGNFRELHTDDALEVMDFSSKKQYKSSYNKVDNNSSSLVSCQYFTANIIKLDKELPINHNDKDSFVVYMCVEGEVMFKSEFNTEVIKKGETLMVPACLKEFDIVPNNKAELLEVFIK